MNQLRAKRMPDCIKLYLYKGYTNIKTHTYNKTTRKFEMNFHVKVNQANTKYIKTDVIIIILCTENNSE